MQVKTYKFFDLSFALKETQEKLYLAFVFVAFLGLALGPSPRVIGMAGSAILALGFPHLLKKIQSIFCEPWFYASLLIVLIAALGLLYSPATTDEKRIIFTKYAKVGYLPILYLAFHHPRAKQVAIHGFLMGMFLTAIISILKFYQLIESSIPDVGFVFYNHIITSYFMSFAIYLCLYQIKMGPRNLQWFYMGLAAVLGFQLFLSIPGGPELLVF